MVTARNAYFEPVDDEQGEELAMHELKFRHTKARRNRRIKITVACVLAGGLLAAAVGRFMMNDAQAAAEFTPQTAIVERKDFSNEVKASGIIKAGSTVDVSSEIDGVIESVNVVEGQTVKEGDVLLTIANEELDKEVQNAQRDLTSAQQNVINAQNNVARAEASREDAWNRYNEAYAKADAAHSEWQYLADNYDSLHMQWESSVSYARSLYPAWASGRPAAPTEPGPDATQDQRDAYTAAYDQYIYVDLPAYEAYSAAMGEAGDEPTKPGIEPVYPETPNDIALQGAIETAQQAVTTANEAVTKAQSTLEDAEKKAAKRTITAPSGGTVTVVTAKVGGVVSGTASNTAAAQAASDKALVQISDSGKMEIDAEVNEVDIMAIKKGQTAKVTFSAVPGVVCDATVLEVASVATSKTDGANGDVTFHAGLIIPKPDKKLRAGMSANVSIVTASEQNVLVLPVDAITESVNGKTVEVVVNDDEESFETVTRQVTTGSRSSDEVVITDGLTAGETVLLNTQAAEEDAKASE